MKKLEMWYQRINNYKRINLNEAQKLYIQMINTTDYEEKIKIRNDIINSTLYIILNFIKKSQLEILENGSYDIDDIISSTIEYYINEIDKGKLLKINSFHSLFGSAYYTYLTSILVPQKENLDMAVEKFGDFIEVFLKLKKNKDDISYKEYLEALKKTRLGYRIDTYYFKSLDRYLFELYNIFNQVYSKVDFDDENIPSKTRLTFMRFLLIDISLRENISSTMKSEDNLEEKVAYNEYIKEAISYIMNDSRLKEREISILIKRNGIDDGHRKTLHELGNMYGLSKDRVRQIEAKALRKLRMPYRKKYIYDEME